jgi:hypothetical protein
VSSFDCTSVLSMKCMFYSADNVLHSVGVHRRLGSGDTNVPCDGMLKGAR